MASVTAEKNNFLIRLLVTVIILAVFVFLFLKDFESEVRSQTPPPLTYIQAMCPENGWVDCMPIVDQARSYQCEAEFLEWAQTNCEGFQGVAL